MSNPFTTAPFPTAGDPRGYRVEGKRLMPDAPPPAPAEPATDDKPANTPRSKTTKE
jgi:hypothetical protein